jgi:hypothetical protein
MPRRKVHRPDWAGPAPWVPPAAAPVSKVLTGLVTLVLTVPARHIEHLDHVTKVAVRDCELEGDHIRAAALALRKAYRNAVTGGVDATES